jgi:hypothetical protein
MKVVFLGEKSLDAADEQMMKRGEKKIIDFRYSDLNAFKLEFPFPFHMRPSVTFPFFYFATRSTLTSTWSEAGTSTSKHWSMSVCDPQ